MNSEGIRKVEQIEGLTDADYNLISARIFEFDDKRVSDEQNRLRFEINQTKVSSN